MGGGQRENRRPGFAIRLLTGVFDGRNLVSAEKNERKFVFCSDTLIFHLREISFQPLTHWNSAKSGGATEVLTKIEPPIRVLHAASPEMSESKCLPVAGTICLLATSLLATSCAVQTSAKRDDLHVMEVSVPQQKMALYRQGELVKTYPVSTSKFGLGDEKGSYRTPLGKMEVAQKIGDGAPNGAVFKSRKWTGEILKPDAPGRDPIVSRILWLNGLEPKNQNAFSRYIYIHGTNAERDVGKPVSYGCVRMKSRDIIDLYGKVGEGAKVFVVRKNLWRDEATARKYEQPVEALPLTEAPALPAGMQPVDPTAVQPVWNEVGTFRTGVDVLVEEGYEEAYLTLPEPSELGLDE